MHDLPSIIKAILSLPPRVPCLVSNIFNLIHRIYGKAFKILAESSFVIYYKRVTSVAYLVFLLLKILYLVLRSCYSSILVCAMAAMLQSALKWRIKLINIYLIDVSLARSIAVTINNLPSNATYVKY